MSDDKPPDLLIASDICQLRLEHLLRECQFASGAMVSTRDGLDVAHKLRHARTASQIAAMCSSLLSVSDAITALSGGKSCANVVIESESGQIVTMSIPSSRHTLLVTVFCLPNASLGQVLWILRKYAIDMGRSLDTALPSGCQAGNLSGKHA